MKTNGSALSVCYGKITLWGDIVIVAVILSYIFFDRSLALCFHNLDGNFYENLVNQLCPLGRSHWYIVPSLVLWLVCRLTGRFNDCGRRALYVFLANVFAGILVWLLKIPFGRLRPNMLFEHGEYGFAGLGISYPYVSFPSGHAATIFAAAVAFAFLFPRFKVPIMVFASVAAFSRVTSGAHYLSDVLVGAYLGGMVSYFLYVKMFLMSQKRQEGVSASYGFGRELSPSN